MRNSTRETNRRNTARFVAAVSIFVFCSMISSAIAQEADLTLCLACEPAELCWGDQLSVLASCENAGEAITVDLYLAVVLPSGGVFYFPEGSLSAPFISNVIIPGSASFSDIEVFSGEMPRGLAAGEYLWVLGATAHGTGDILTYATTTMRLGYDCWESYGNINNVRSLLVRGSDLFIGTANAGIVRYDLETGHYERYGVSDGLASSEVNHLCIDDKRNVWAALGSYIYMPDNWDDDWGGISRLGEGTWQSYYPTEDGQLPDDFRRSNRMDVVAYSTTDDAVYAVSLRGDLYRVTAGRVERDIPPEGRFSTKWVSNHPDGSVYVKVGSVLRRYAKGLWSKVADGGWYPFMISSDGTVWSAGSSEAHRQGLWRLSADRVWEPIEVVGSAFVREIAEASGQIWVLTRDYRRGHTVCVFDGDDWSEVAVPSSEYDDWDVSMAVSDDGVAYVGTSEGILKYKSGGWSRISFDCPSFKTESVFPGAEGPTDASFWGSASYFIRLPWIDKVDGDSWSSLPDVPYGFLSGHYMATLFVDSRGTAWCASYDPGGYSVVLWRDRDGTWTDMSLDASQPGYYFPNIAEDALGRLWFHSFIGRLRDDPVWVINATSTQEYGGIHAAVEANFDLLIESNAKTDIWMVDKQHGIIWVRWTSLFRPISSVLALSSFDGEAWTHYEEELPGGGKIFFDDGDTQAPVDIDAQGNVWALTGKGLCRLNASGVWYEPSGRMEDLGLPLLADDYGHVWVARSMDNTGYSSRPDYHGVARFDTATQQWEDLTEQDVPICNWIWRMRSAPNGDVWFCTRDGAARYSQGPK